MKNLRSVSFEELHPDTQDARRMDCRLDGWSVSQCWAWDGGDAAVIVMAELPMKVTTYTVVRVGIHLGTIPNASLTEAVRELRKSI